MKKIFLLTIAILTFAASASFAHLYSRTDNLSLRYILWKNGMYPYSAQFYSSLYAERDRSFLVRDKTREEILAIFPDAHESPVDEYQQRYEKRELKGHEHLWIGKSNLVIFLENGIGKSMFLMKD